MFTHQEYCASQIALSHTLGPLIAFRSRLFSLSLNSQVQRESNARDSTPLWTEAVAPTLLQERDRVEELVGDFALAVAPACLARIHAEIVEALDDLEASSRTTYEAIACYGYGCRTLEWKTLFKADKKRRWALIAYKKARDCLGRVVGAQGIRVPANAVLDSMVAAAPESKL